MSAPRTGAAVVSKGKVVRGGFAQVGRVAPTNSADRTGAVQLPATHPAAVLVLEDEREAAAVVTYLTPGLRFFYQGQLEGRRKRVSPHLARAPQEAQDEVVRLLYDRLLSVLRSTTVRHGQWQLLECVTAGDGHWTSDCHLAWLWTGKAGDSRLVVVNYSGHESQCYVRLPAQGESIVRFENRMGGHAFERDGHDLDARGLYLDMPPWGYHVFEMSALGSKVC